MEMQILTTVICCLLAAGCATIPVGQHQPGADSVVSLRDSGIAPINVGEFKLADGVNPQIDQSVSVRGRPVQSPNSKSFVLYLKESLIADLRAAGKFDPAAATSIHAELMENALHAAGIALASASLEARFMVYRGDQQVYNKVLHQQSTWESSFVGAIAIPEATNHYTDQYTQLLTQLYSDADFRKACSISP
jgi:hypothetical protein